MTDFTARIKNIRDTETKIEAMRSQQESDQDQLLSDCASNFKAGMTKTEVISKINELGLNDPSLSFSQRFMDWVSKHLPDSDVPLDSQDIYSLRANLSNFLIEAVCPNNY